MTWNEYKSEEFDLDENEDEDSIARDPERIEVRSSFVRSNDLLQILELDIVLFKWEMFQTNSKQEQNVKNSNFDKNRKYVELHNLFNDLTI